MHARALSLIALALPAFGLTGSGLVDAVLPAADLDDWVAAALGLIERPKRGTPPPSPFARQAMSGLMPKCS